ncbi:MAG: type II secretion system protein [bacterium]|nr:type II secretion system protein [bacterium]
MFKQINKAKAGFTLIELLVVIAIIGILASIVLASLNTARTKARDAKRIGDIRQLQLALALYADSSVSGGGGGGNYPIANATCAGTPGAPTTNAFGLEALTPTYIQTLPHDPNKTAADATVDSGCYHYASGTAAVAYYHLAAALEGVDNSAFDSDRDCDSSTTAGGTQCFTAAVANPFNGNLDSVALPYYDVTN